VKQLYLLQFRNCAFYKTTKDDSRKNINELAFPLSTQQARSSIFQLFSFPETKFQHR